MKCTCVPHTQPDRPSQASQVTSADGNHWICLSLAHYTVRDVRLPIAAHRESYTLPCPLLSCSLIFTMQYTPGHTIQPPPVIRSITSFLIRGSSRNPQRKALLSALAVTLFLHPSPPTKAARLTEVQHHARTQRAIDSLTRGIFLRLLLFGGGRGWRCGFDALATVLRWLWRAFSGVHVRPPNIVMVK